MWFFRPIITFMLFCQATAIEQETTDDFESMHEVERLPRPIDFRCAVTAFTSFEFAADYYDTIYYTDPDITSDRKGTCMAYAPDQNTILHYPIITAFDPMLAFYIHTIYKGLPVFANTDRYYSLNNPMHRRKYYCSDIRLIGSTFAEYFERFPSDDETCWKLKEIIIECYNYRQMRRYWVQNVYDKLCLDEDGCFNIVEYYGDDLPYCVKYIATGQFRNASFGSWHHSFINYCQLTDLIPEARYTNYDRLIVRESGRTEEQLKLMCEYLRFHLLYEEGKEGEISETKTGKDDRSTCGKYYWNLLYITVIMVYFPEGIGVVNMNMVSVDRDGGPTPKTSRNWSFEAVFAHRFPWENIPWGQKIAFECETHREKDGEFPVRNIASDPVVYVDFYTRTIRKTCMQEINNNNITIKLTKVCS